MALRDIIKEIQKLTTPKQLRLKDFFIKSLASYPASEPIFKDISEQKHKDGYTCTHCHSTNAVRFGKYKYQSGSESYCTSEVPLQGLRKNIYGCNKYPIKGSFIFPTNGWILSIV